jgi:hypothetical protein
MVFSLTFIALVGAMLCSLLHQLLDMFLFPGLLNIICSRCFNDFIFHML